MKLNKMNKNRQLKNLKRKIKNLKIKYKNIIKKSIAITSNSIIDDEPSAYYKYMNQNTLLLLIKNRTIKITNPIKFNDPMDSSIPNIKINDLYIKKVILDVLNEKYHEEINGYKSEFEQELNIEILKLKKEFEVISAELIKEWSSLISHFRVLSLTTKGDNLLMWSHYANEHKGVVIKFKENLSLGRPIKINYYDGHQRLNDFFNKTIALIIKEEVDAGFSDENTDKLSDITLKVMLNYFFMKMSEWQYESEYRIVYEKDHSKIKNINADLDVLAINENDIECIIIGSSVSLLRARRLKFLIQARFPQVEVRRYQRVGWELKSEKIN